MSSRSRSAADIIGQFIARATRQLGGAMLVLIRSRRLVSFGDAREASVARRNCNPSQVRMQVTANQACR
jgi:hypothetical protein